MKKTIIILFLLPVFCKAQEFHDSLKRTLPPYSDSSWGFRYLPYYPPDTTHYVEIDWDSTHPLRRRISDYYIDAKTGKAQKSKTK